MKIFIASLRPKPMLRAQQNSSGRARLSLTPRFSGVNDGRCATEPLQRFPDFAATLLSAKPLKRLDDSFGRSGTPLKRGVNEITHRRPSVLSFAHWSFEFVSDFGSRISVLLLGVLLALFASPAFGQGADDNLATFFMGRVKYSSNDGNDCGGVGQDLMKLVSRASTIKIQEERKVRLTDPELFETPFLFMNGHNDFVLTDAEIANLRKFLSHGGFFFASGCCTNPNFPKAWRREFSRIFPNEKVQPIPYDHLIYRSFYKIDRIRCLNEPRDIQLEGLFYQGNLVAVLCEDGLCCAFSASNTCNEGKGISPEDGQRLTLNIAVYALTH